MDEIKNGDVVTLKSGGPSLTVVYLEPGNLYSVTCVWFEPSSGTFVEKKFPAYCLAKKD